MELRNRGRKPIDNVLLPELKGINRVLSGKFSFVHREFIILRWLYFEDPSDYHINVEEQMEMFWESFRKSSTELSEGRLNNITEVMNTLRVNAEVWEKRLGGSLYMFTRLLADLCARVDEITVESWQKLLDDPSCEELVEKVWYAVVVSTVALLSSVYHYLLGYDLKGGTKAYSPGSLDFRDTFVSLLLFQGSYVWIFFRDVVPRKVYRRSKKDEAGRVSYYGKFEPRFKPHREKLPGGTTIKFDHLPLGGYGSHRDAEIVCQIAGYYYKRDEADIKLRDGSYFTIPPMPEQEQSLIGLEKVRCVVARAKEVFRDFQVINDAIILPCESNTVGVHDFFQHVVREEFSLDALLDAADVHPVDWEFADSFGADGEGLGGIPASPSLAEQVVRPQSLDTVSSDAGFMTKQDSSIQKLKEQLEVFSRRITEQHEQHLQQQKQLEEHMTKIQLENEERIGQLQLENEFLKCLMH